MSTSVKVNVGVELIENDDGTFAVTKSTFSETYVNGEMVSRTQPTLRREKVFKNKNEAEAFFASERMSLGDNS